MIPERTDQKCEISTCSRTLKPKAVQLGFTKCWSCWYTDKIGFRTFRIQNSEDVKQQRLEKALEKQGGHEFNDVLGDYRGEHRGRSN